MSKLVTNSKKTKKLNALQTLLAKHKDQFQTLSNGKIKCLMTGHQFLPSEQNLLDHMNSKSYKKATESKFDISEYQEVLITHKDNEHFLFCRLTGAKVPKKKTSIQKHINGRRFKQRLQQYKAQMQKQEGQEDEQQLIDDQQIDENDQQLEEEEQQQQQEEVKPMTNGKLLNNKKPNEPSQNANKPQPNGNKPQSNGNGKQQDKKNTKTHKQQVSNKSKKQLPKEQSSDDQQQVNSNNKSKNISKKDKHLSKRQYKNKNKNRKRRQ